MSELKIIILNNKILDKNTDIIYIFNQKIFIIIIKTGSNKHNYSINFFLRVAHVLTYKNKHV